MKKVNLILSTLFSLLASINFAQWTSVGAPDFTSAGALDISLQIKQNGTPIVLYRSLASDSIYAFENINNSWVQLSGLAVAPTTAYDPQLALDQNDIPHVIYRNVNDSIFIKKWKDYF